MFRESVAVGGRRERGGRGGGGGRRGGGRSTMKGQTFTPDVQMSQGLFSASRAPAREADIRRYQTLHRPKLHG